MGCAKEMIRVRSTQGHKPPFKVLQAGPGVLCTSSIGPFAAQAIRRVGSLFPHYGKMLYRQREKKNHLEVGVSAKEGEGHSEGEGSRLGMPAMMITEGRSFWHQSM